MPSMDRRRALSTAGKIGAGVVAAGLVAGTAGYFAGSSTAPVSETGPQTKTTTVTQKGDAVTRTTTVTQQAQAAAKGAGHTGIYVANEDIDSGDPHRDVTFGVQFYTNVYDHLTIALGAGVPTPFIANRWIISDDGLDYKFWIRKGIKFHDGEILNAQSVKFSFDRAVWIAKEKGGSAAGNIRTQLSEVTTNDADQTVTLSLNDPFAPFLKSFYQVAIMSEKTVMAHESDGDWGTEWLETNDAGSGPYKVAERQVGSFIRTERFDGYWGGWPDNHYDTAIYKKYADQASAFTAIVNKEGALTDKWFAVETYKKFEKEPTLDVHWTDDVFVFYILMNNQLGRNPGEPPLYKKEVRQALSYAVDYDSMINDVLGGVERGWKKMVGPIAGFMEGFDPTTKEYTYDPDKAKALLRGVGEEGFKMTVEHLAGFEVHRRLATLYGSNLADIGLDVEVQAAPIAEMIARLADPKTGTHGMPLQFGSGSADPDDLLYRQFSKSYWTSAPTVFSAANYEDPDNIVDPPLLASRKETNAAKRAGLLSIVQKQLAEDAATIPLTQVPQVHAIQKDIDGYAADLPSPAAYRPHRFGGHYGLTPPPA